jgi:predicted permease
MWRRRRSDALDGLDDEIRDHIEREVEMHMARGFSPDEARRRANLAFGNVALVQEDTRAVWTWTWLEQWRQDLRFGARILTNSPGLSFTAAVLIALVIGINTTIFSMVDGLVTRPAPGVETTGLVRIVLADRPGASYFSFPDYQDYAAQTTTLQSVTASTNGRVTLASPSGSFAVFASAVDANYFDTVGIHVAKGRAFTASEGEARDATGLVAIISDHAWHEYFGGAEDVVGRSISVNGRPATIIGVAPPAFRGVMLMERADIWLPLVMFWRVIDADALPRWLTDRTETPVDMIGRLAPGQSISGAQTEFATIQARLERSYPVGKRSPVSVVRYSATSGGVIPAGAPTFLAIFSIVTLLTVLIVSANVANLMLARAAARQRETAVRQSLGASRARIVRLLLAEGLSISLVAWAAACMMTVWAARAIPRLMPQSPLAGSGLDFTPDWRVIGYAMLLAGVGTVAFTLVPAIRAWLQDPLPWLKAGEHSVAQGRSRLSNALVVLQLAFSVVLLTGAGLATRSAGLMKIDLGFDMHNLLLVTVRTSASAATRESNLVLVDQIRERLRRIPGVTSVSYVRNVPPFAWSRELIRTHGGSETVFATMHVVGPDYFAVLGLAQTAGRPLTDDDLGHSDPVAVINENLAQAMWPGESALGRTITFGASPESLPGSAVFGRRTEGPTIEIVGVAPNAYVAGFNPERPDPRPNLIFVPAQQAFALRGRGDPAAPGEFTFYLRHQASAFEHVASSIGPELRAVDPRVAIAGVQTMDTQLEGVTFTAHLIARLLAIFSVVSLLIAAIGQYAVIAFNMRRRVREFGVRIALGASAGQVLRAVLDEGLALTGIGLIAGLLLSLGVAMLTRRALFGVTPTDPMTYGGVVALLTCVALTACCLPARAATRVDPVQALRQE